MKTVSGRVVVQSIAFWMVSVYWQGVAPFPWYLNAKGPTPIGSTWRCAVLSADAGLLVDINVMFLLVIWYCHVSALVHHTCIIVYICFFLFHCVLRLLHFNFKSSSHILNTDILTWTCPWVFLAILLSSDQCDCCLYIAAEKRDERVKFVLESDVISRVKTVLTSVPQCHQVAVRLIAELVKTGSSVIGFEVRRRCNSSVFSLIRMH